MQEVLPLHLIATTLIRLKRDQHYFLSAPYPANLQRALDLLTVDALRRGLAPPQNVLELLDWCRIKPLSQWPLTFEGRQMAEDVFLLEDDLPTSWCEEWACAASDVEDEVTENGVIEAALRLCEALNSPQLYVDFRRLLIERPVLTQFELLHQQRRLKGLENVLVDAYELAPSTSRHAGRFIACKRCGSLLVLNLVGDLCCEDSLCRAEGSVQRGKDWDENVLQLKRGLRRFVTRPGRAELRLFKALKKRGYVVELWPDFDLYDLKVVVDDEIWAIDVKDWADPFLLAYSLNEKGPFRPSTSAPWNRAFWIFPKERRERRNYLVAFENTYQHLNPRVKALFDIDFLRSLPDA